MGVFLKKLFVFIVIGVGIAYSLQWVIDSGLKKSNYCAEYKEWYEIMNSKINADILIQGSSRARLQISPWDFEKQFKLSTYNIGLDGSLFPIQNYRLNQYLKYNKPPRYLIQVIDVNTLNDQIIKFNFQQYIPYLTDDFIKEFGNQSVFSTKDFYIPLHKYTHQQGMVVAGITNLFNSGPSNNGNYKGFCSVNKSYDKKVLTDILKDNPHGIMDSISHKVYNQFIAFIKNCKKDHIKLVLITPPSLFSYQKKVKSWDSNISIITKLSEQYQVKYLNYSNDAICSDTSMFFDFFHLNSKGIKIFNEKLIMDLKDEIKR